MSDRRLNVGMIGAGYIGQIAHLSSLAEIEECRIVALAELRPELRDRVAVRYAIPRTYETHEQLLGDPEVEAVVVVTPRPHTGPVALDCLRAGKHVLTEKPMAGSVEQGERLVAAARDAGARYAVGYMKRHDAGVQAAKQILDDVLASGRLGPVLFARAHCFMGESYCNAGGHVVTDEKVEYSEGGWPIAPGWVPAGRALDYAAFLNTYSHNTNLLRFLFDRTPGVDYARLSPGAGQVAVLDFGDFAATLETGRGSSRDWDEIAEIWFADGHLRVRTPPALLRNVPARVELYEAGEMQQIRSPQCDWTWSFRRQAEAFVSDVLYDRPSLADGADALEDLRLVEAIWRFEIAHGEKQRD